MLGVPQLPASSVFARALTERACSEQGATRLAFVGCRLERRDDATEALEEAKEVRHPRPVNCLED